MCIPIINVTDVLTGINDTICEGLNYLDHKIYDVIANTDILFSPCETGKKLEKKWETLTNANRPDRQCNVLYAIVQLAHSIFCILIPKWLIQFVNNRLVSDTSPQKKESTNLLTTRIALQLINWLCTSGNRHKKQDKLWPTMASQENMQSNREESNTPPPNTIKWTKIGNRFVIEKQNIQQNG